MVQRLTRSLIDVRHEKIISSILIVGNSWLLLQLSCFNNNSSFARILDCDINPGTAFRGRSQRSSSLLYLSSNFASAPELSMALNLEKQLQFVRIFIYRE